MHLLGEFDRLPDGNSVYSCPRRRLRFASRLAMASRLSYSFFPFAIAISTFARPFFRYNRAGTIVTPFWRTPYHSFRISSLCSRSLRGRRGSWLKNFPDCSQGAIWASISQASRSLICTYASARLMCPARIDFISLPCRAIPASNFSNRKYSNFAFLLVATIFMPSLIRMFLFYSVAISFGRINQVQLSRARIHSSSRLLRV
jgi:hypothetical protein